MDRFASARVFVADIERSAPRLPKLTKQKLLRIGVAGAFATGMLAAVPSAQARITKIQIGQLHSVEIRFQVWDSTR